jgi:hypothetical protein
MSGSIGNRERQLLAEQRPKFRRNVNQLMGYRARQIVLSTVSNSRWFQTPQSFCRWLFAQPSTFNYLAGLLSVAINFSRTIPVLVGHTGLVLTSRHAGWGKTR